MEPLRFALARASSTGAERTAEVCEIFGFRTAQSLPAPSGAACKLVQITGEAHSSHHAINLNESK